MRFFNTPAVILALAAAAGLPLSVSACEGACITNTTNKYIEKYATPIKSLVDHTNHQLASQFNLPASTNCASHLEDAYAKVAYSYLEHAIFPSYFHGKCQQHTVNGTLANPPGCPNPDCPVVCGTPGSMVHFFSVLRNITVKTHENIFSILTKQDSESFQDVKTCVIDAMPTKLCARSTAHTSRSISRLFEARFPRSMDVRYDLSPREKCIDDATFEKDLFDNLQVTTVQTWPELCDARKDYAKCSWENEMKAFILQFP
ncbi:hypothetical protein EV361DRAFT_896716 [Lentinula raphanica]|nr:hypothetical protein EV361DRAFT_896716 [Lentinula raphanica]